MATLFNEEVLAKLLQEHLRADIAAVAEPIIKKACEDFEIGIRKKIAAAAIATVEGAYVMERMGPDIRITVRRDGNGT